MEVGQPGTPGAGGRPRRAGARRWTRGRSATPWRSACRRSGARIARLYRDWYGVDLDPAPRRGHRRLVGRLHPRLHQPLRARRPGGDRRSRLSELPQHPAGARPRAGRHRHRPRGPLPAGARATSTRRPRRGAGGEPGQPDRHHAGALRARGADRAGGASSASPSSRTRSTTASSTAPARSRRSRSPTRSTSSTPSRSTSR